jgi:hypothetical protein
MWRRVDHVGSDISVESVDSIVGVQRITELGTTLAGTNKLNRAVRKHCMRKESIRGYVRDIRACRRPPK